MIKSIITNRQLVLKLWQALEDVPGHSKVLKDKVSVRWVSTLFPAYLFCAITYKGEANKIKTV